MKKPLIYGVYDNITPSPMEAVIARYLVSNRYNFRREVEFDKCINPVSGFFMRFDFLLFDYSILIEYDGIEFHQCDAVIERDDIKNKFAAKHGFTLVRLQGTKEVDRFLNTQLPFMPLNLANCEIRKRYFRVSSVQRRKNRKKYRD